MLLAVFYPLGGFMNKIDLLSRSAIVSLILPGTVAGTQALAATPRTLN
jgi:hypothetical protein